MKAEIAATSYSAVGRKYGVSDKAVRNLQGNVQKLGARWRVSVQLFDAATQRILSAINASGQLRVSSTTLQGRIAIRLAFLHPRTAEAHIDAVEQIVKRVLQV